jgi:hypothetical protein
MNDEKEVARKLARIFIGNVRIKHGDVYCFEDMWTDEIEAHGKSCYERGLKNGDWQKDNRIELEGQITRLKERVKELTKEAEELLSQDTSEFKSAAFQKIKSLEQRLAEAELCLKNANALIADQADENEKIITRLKERVAEAEYANKGLTDANIAMQNTIRLLDHRLANSWAKVKKDDLAVFIERESGLGGADSNELATALVKFLEGGK